MYHARPSPSSRVRTAIGLTVLACALTAPAMLAVATSWERAPGAVTCAPGLMVDTEEECRRAGPAVGAPFEKVVNQGPSDFGGAGRPGGCFWDQSGGSYFNQNLGSTATWGGVGGICRSSAPATPVPARASGWSRAPGAVTCAPGLMVDTEEECRRAGPAVGAPFEKVVNQGPSDFGGAGRPGGCFWDQNGGSYFNQNLGSTATWGGVGGICRSSAPARPVVAYLVGEQPPDCGSQQYESWDSSEPAREWRKCMLKQTDPDYRDPDDVIADRLKKLKGSACGQAVACVVESVQTLNDMCGNFNPCERPGEELASSIDRLRSDTNFASACNVASTAVGTVLALKDIGGGFSSSVMCVASVSSHASGTRGVDEFYAYLNAHNIGFSCSTEVLAYDVARSVCMADSYYRGIGTPLQCAPGLDRDGELCYEPCEDGWGSAGPVCWQNCPSGYRDDGAFCAKPNAYGRGAGYPWKFGDDFNLDDARDRCEDDHGEGGCEQYDQIIYPKCRDGFHNTLCCICSPDCPSGFVDMGVSCTKPTQTRGAGKVPDSCPEGKERYNALCYPKCLPGFKAKSPGDRCERTDKTPTYEAMFQ